MKISCGTVYMKRGKNMTKKYSEDAIYAVVETIFNIIDKKIDKKVACNELEMKYNFNPNSANDGIYGIGAMLDGKKYTRTLNTLTTRIAFEKIEKDYGINSLQNAISATQKHVDYYENKTGNNMHAIRKIIEEFTLKAVKKPILYLDETVLAEEKYIKGKLITIQINGY